MTRWLRDGLLGLLAFCLVIRVGAALVADAVPVLIVLTFLVGIYHVLLFGRAR